MYDLPSHVTASLPTKQFGYVFNNHFLVWTWEKKTKKHFYILKFFSTHFAIENKLERRCWAASSNQTNASSIDILSPLARIGPMYAHCLNLDREEVSRDCCSRVSVPVPNNETIRFCFAITTRHMPNCKALQHLWDDSPVKNIAIRVNKQ